MAVFFAVTLLAFALVRVVPDDFLFSIGLNSFSHPFAMLLFSSLFIPRYLGKLLPSAIKKENIQVIKTGPCFGGHSPFQDRHFRF